MRQIPQTQSHENIEATGSGMKSTGAELETFYVLSLGCPKNRVDSEWVSADLRRAGLRQVEEPEDADLVLVNTCAFIQAAVEESLDAVLEAAAWKTAGACRKVVLMGCMAQRYGRELAAELPEVDFIVGCSELGSVPDMVLGSDRAVALQPSAPSYLPGRATERIPSLGPHMAYLKVAEGCNRTCSFCTVPSIRGRQRSRPIAELVEETEMLVAQGVREVVLVAQDLVTYGRDIGTDLPALLGALGRVSGLDWLRAMYLYPSGLDDRLLGALAETCVPYLDLPIQHVSDRVLRAMNRHYEGHTIEDLFDRIERIWPEAWIRATLLVGHPHEGRRDFEVLRRFVERRRIDHLGLFAYSPEEGTASASLRPRPRRSTAEARRDELMSLAMRQSADRLRRMRGRKLDVLIEGITGEFLYVGRHAGQAPEVDGLVYVTGDERQADGAARLSVGDMVSVRLDDSGDYDLVGSVVGPAVSAG